MNQNEKNLLLEPREAFYRPFDLGQWTELRVGMYFKIVNTTSDSGSHSNESISINSNTDRIYIGLKDSGSNMPGVAGTNFIGMTSVSGSGVRSDSPYSNFGDNSGSLTYPRLYLSAFSGSSNYNAYFRENTATGPAFADNAFSYNGFFGIKYILLNSGSADQQVQVTYKRVYLVIPQVVSNDTGTSSIDLHRHLLSEVGWTNPPASNTASWAAGIPLPNSFFAYSPLYNNRLRIGAIEVLKIS